MTRYGLGQLLFAFVLTAVGAIKAVRLMLDEIDDATCKWTGLS